MAKPIGNGKSMEMNGKSNAALDRSWLVAWDDEEGFTAVNRGGVGDSNDGEGTSESPFLGSDSNDFFYIDPSLGFSGEGDETPIYGNLTIESENDEGEIELTIIGPDDPLLPYIDGLGGADQIIMMEEAIIGDTFFTNIDNVTVFKLWDGNDAVDEYAFTGSQVTLAEEAQDAGILEVTGGPGDDVIDFSGYAEPDSYDPDVDPIEIIIRGGAGADEMTASDLSDIFLWEAGDLENTDAENFDTVYEFDVDYDTLDIAGLLAGFGYKDGVDTLAEWVNVYVSDGHTFVEVDPDGSGVDEEFTDLVQLNGVGDITGDLIFVTA